MLNVCAGNITLKCLRILFYLKELFNQMTLSRVDLETVTFCQLWLVWHSTPILLRDFSSIMMSKMGTS